MKDLENKKVVIAIDTKDLNGQELSEFLKELFGWAGKVMILLVCRGRGIAESVPYTGLAESTISVGPLPFRQSAILFGTLCPLLSKCADNLTPTQFSEIVVPKHEEDNKAGDYFSERSVLVLRIIGEGIPAKTITAAQSIEKEQFDKLLKICKLDHFRFTPGREKRLKELADDLELKFKKRQNRKVENLPPFQEVDVLTEELSSLGTSDDLSSANQVPGGTVVEVEIKQRYLWPVRSVEIIGWHRGKKVAEALSLPLGSNNTMLERFCAQLQHHEPHPLTISQEDRNRLEKELVLNVDWGKHILG
uniref:Uncharacterized protein n=1 Tax=Pseudictyota dubia TaxID=2749911 RepID=A0A7R9WD01_9STRA